MTRRIPKSPATLALFALTALIAITATASERVTAMTSERERSFTFSADPAKRVLWMELIGDDVYVATIYGDGRLEYVRASRDRSRPLEEASTTLSFEHVRGLMEIALRSGLAEYSEALLHEKVRKATAGNPPMSLHKGKTIIGFSLESLGEREEFEIEIHCENVDGLTTAYPTIPEYQGIRELTQRIFAHWRATFKESSLSKHAPSPSRRALAIRSGFDGWVSKSPVEPASTWDWMWPTSSGAKVRRFNSTRPGRLSTRRPSVQNGGGGEAGVALAGRGKSLVPTVALVDDPHGSRNG